MATVTQAQYDELPWQEVESSNIARVAWIKTGASALDANVFIGKLYVEFGSSEGRAYAYENVTEDIHADFLEAHSVGSFFAHNIRGCYEHERVEVEVDG